MSDTALLLDKIDRGLKTVGVILGGLATLAATGAGADGSGAGALIPGWLGILFGFGAMVAMFLSASPIFTSAGPWATRIVASIAGLCAAASASTFLPKVQSLMAPGHAHRLASGLALVGAVAALVLKSPLLAGPPAPPPTPPSAG